MQRFNICVFYSWLPILYNTHSIKKGLFTYWGCYSRAAYVHACSCKSAASIQGQLLYKTLRCVCLSIGGVTINTGAAVASKVHQLQLKLAQLQKKNSYATEKNFQVRGVQQEEETIHVWLKFNTIIIISGLEILGFSNSCFKVAIRYRTKVTSLVALCTLTKLKRHLKTASVIAFWETLCVWLV